ncbi:WASH complex subunit 1-like [Artemia franciscana]
MSEAKIASLKAMLDSKDTLIEDLQTAKMKLEQKNADFVERLRASEKLRRKLHGQMQDMKKDELVSRERKETGQEMVPEGFLDMRSSLMDAIRQAGGAGKAKLKSVVKTTSEEPTQEITRDEKSKSAVKPGGDLMSDLMAKLSTRRKGISGPPATKLLTPAQPSAPSGIFEKISSLIFQPEEDSQPDEEEDVWNDS